MAIKVGKTSTIFSDNEKMDGSGITAKMPQYGYMMEKVPPKNVTGGTLYMKAIADCETNSKAESITTKTGLKKMANLVNKGVSPYSAAEIVRKEVEYSPDCCED